jgi:hypothetical protein
MDLHRIREQVSHESDVHHLPENLSESLKNLHCIASHMRRFAAIYNQRIVRNPAVHRDFLLSKKAGEATPKGAAGFN